jgi:autotransporter-associated beta strand protein
LGSSGALGTGTLAVTADATLANSSPMALGNTIALSNNANLTVETANALILSGDLGGNGNLIKTGVDDLTLVGVKTFTGNVDIQAGSLTTLGSGVLANVGTSMLAPAASSTQWQRQPGQPDRQRPS